MKKTTSILLIFLVLGFAKPSKAVAPALALLNPAVLGSVVVAGGVMSGAAAHYAPAVYEAGQSAVDQAAKFHRTLYQAQKFVLSSGVEYFVGRAEEITAELGNAGSVLYDWVVSNPLVAPLLNSAIEDSLIPGDPVLDPGTTILNDTDIGGGQIGSVQLLGPFDIPHYGYLSTTEGNCQGVSTPQWFNPVFGNYSKARIWYQESSVYPGQWECWYQDYNVAVNPDNLPVDNNSIFDPTAFADSISSLPAQDVASEIDSMIAANPLAFSGSPSWSTSETTNAVNLVQSAITDQAAADAAAALASDPTNTDLQIAAADAALVADLAAAAAAAPAEEIPEVMPTVGPVEISSIDFSPLLALQDIAMTKFPFNLLSSVAGFFSIINAAPVTPYFEWQPLIFNSPVTISLSSWDKAAAIFRGIIILFFNASMIFLVVKRWS